MKLIKAYIVLIIFTLITISGINYSNTLPPSQKKKVDKELNYLWPDKSLRLIEFQLDAELSSQAREIGIMDIYSLIDEDQDYGYMVYFKVPSKFDFFDLALFYDQDLHIRSMKVLQYREDHGGEVASKRWLMQFVGLGNNDPILLNEDIQGISGATISCESATVGAKEVTSFMDQIKSTK